MDELKTVTCNNCGWVHFGVSLKYAQKEVSDFNAYFDSLSKEKQQDYYGGKKSSLDNYLSCMTCGGSYRNFRDSDPGDCPLGCTINPILNRDEVV